MIGRGETQPGGSLDARWTDRMSAAMLREVPLGICRAEGGGSAGLYFWGVFFAPNGTLFRTVFSPYSVINQPFQLDIYMPFRQFAPTELC